MTVFISIPKPCSENWNEMDPTDKGVFCSKCTKEVIDCTSVKTSEINAKIGAQKDPCVRIFSEQIDEMNFLEWFKSLKLKIQLKYAFLFAFLIVFNTNIKAQDTIIRPVIDPIQHPIQDDSCHQTNDYYWDGFGIQSVDFDSLNPWPDTIKNVALEDSISQDSLPLIESKIEAETEVKPEGLVIDGEVNIWEPWMGDVMCTPTTGFAIYGNWTAIDEPSSPFLQNNNAPFELITNSNQLTLNNSRYSFYIEGDSLRFMSYAVEPERVRISISKKGEINPIYFNPIQIERGKSEILFPLDDFDNGVYVVTVKGEQNTKAIELVYW